MAAFGPTSPKRRAFASWCATGLLAPLASVADEKPYPSRPVRLVVPFPAGGTTDTLARLVSNKLAERLRQMVIVDNRPGAGGILGNDAVAKSPADGYTILLAITSLIQAPALYASLPYEVPGSFEPISQVATVSDFFVVGNGVRAAFMRDYVATVKSEPGRHNFGSYGNATSSHIHGEMLNRQAGLDLVHTPYKGAPALITDIIGGQIEGGFVDVASLLPYLATGKLKVLAVTGSERVKQAPSVPTFTELGYKNFEPYGLFGFLAPRNTPRTVVNRLGDEIAAIVRSPEITARIEAMGLRAVADGPDAFAKVLQSDLPIWSEVIKNAKIKID